MGTIMGNGVTIRGGKSRAGARISTTLNEDGTQNVFIEDNVNTIIDTAKSIFSVSYNKVLVPLIGSSTPSKLQFTYTGEYNERLEDGVIELLTSGTLVFKNEAAIDAFLVGGGASGRAAQPLNAGGSGGGGGYTKTLLNITPRINTEYHIVIGAGGAECTSYTNTSNPGESTSAFGSSVDGGDRNSGTFHNGGNGGSGGGAGGTTNTIATKNAANGGSDGSSGEGTYNNYSTGGTGQGSTTREFGEATGKLYAAGGGGGSTYDRNGQGTAGKGGEGGGGNGGSVSVKPTPGQENTGSGGGGGTASTESYKNGAAGGSGIVCIRLHKEKKTLSGTYKLNAAPLTTPSYLPTAQGQQFTENFTFTSNGVEYNKIVFYHPGGSVFLYYQNDSTTTSVYNFTQKTYVSSDAALRTITLKFNDTEVSEEFYNWFIANTNSGSDTKILAGTYTFKNTLTSVSSDVIGSFVFSTNSINMIKMVFTTKNILQYWQDTAGYTPAYGNTSWRDNTLKTVILPYDATVDTDFYTWFTSNTTKTS